DQDRSGKQRAATSQRSCAAGLSLETALEKAAELDRIGTGRRRPRTMNESAGRWLSAATLSPKPILLELMYCMPLVALVVASLLLIALKRISSLPVPVKRLAAPPFYCVSLPIATLIVGAEILALILYVFADDIRVSEWHTFVLRELFVFYLSAKIFPFASF